MYSTFPFGFNGGLAVRQIPVAPAHPSKVIYVGNNTTLLQGEKSASDTANKGGFLDPYSTLAVALDNVASGDFIYVRPGYTQAISTADLDIDVNGVTIIGMGTGDSRPTITYTGTTDTTTVDISANNVRLFNFLFTSTDNTGVDDAVIINGTDVELAFCEFRSDSDDFFDRMLTLGKIDNDADRAWIHDNKFVSRSAGVNSAIAVVFDHAEVLIERNWIDGDWADSGIEFPTAGNAQVALMVRNNYVRNRQTGDHAIQIAAITSGTFERNTLVADTLTAIISQVANAIYIDNLGNLADASTTGPHGGSFYVPANLYPTQRLITRQQTGSMATGYGVCDDPTEFTVSGLVKIWDAYAHITTAITSTCATGTIALGTADVTNLLLASVTCNATNMAQHDVWANATTTVNGDRTIGSGAPAIIANGVDIKSYIGTNAMTAGAANIYLEWTPVTEDGNIVAAG